MIKNFSEFINEDYFSKLANRKDTGTLRKENELTEDDVRNLLRDGFKMRVKTINIRKENGKTVVDIDGDFYLRTDVEQIPFQFGKVTGDFSCSDCKNLKSLEGCPKEVGCNFSCTSCISFTSLEGGPEKVGRDFICSYCENLTSLEGCPKKIPGRIATIGCLGITSLKGGPEFVGNSIVCDKCKNLTSLEGCPEYVYDVLSLYGCSNLTSLEGCPKEVGNTFDCRKCGRQFTVQEVKSLCNVKGNIYV